MFTTASNKNFLIQKNVDPAQKEAAGKINHKPGNVKSKRSERTDKQKCFF
jgi:hypothetical protein